MKSIVPAATSGPPKRRDFPCVLAASILALLALLGPVPTPAAASVHWTGTMEMTISTPLTGELGTGVGHGEFSANWTIDSNAPEGEPHYALDASSVTWSEHDRVDYPGSACGAFEGVDAGGFGVLPEDAPPNPFPENGVDARVADGFFLSTAPTSTVFGSSTPFAPVTYTSRGGREENGECLDPFERGGVYPYEYGAGELGSPGGYAFCSPHLTGPLPRDEKTVQGSISNSECGESTRFSWDLEVSCPDGSAPDLGWHCTPEPEAEDEGPPGPVEEPAGEEQTPKECEELGIGPDCLFHGGELPGETPPDVKPPEEEDKGCNHHGFASRKWSARVPLPALPDAHLFDFQVSLPYCYDGKKVARFNGPSAFGSVDYGFDTGLLEALGFETIYDPSKESVYASDFGTAELTGQFAITFAWSTLIDKVGVKKLLKDQAEKLLERELLKLIPKYGLGKSLRRQMAEKMSSIERQVLDRMKDKLEKIKPGFLRNLIEPRVLDKMEGFMDEWRGKAAPLFNSRGSASKLAEKAIGKLFSLIDPRSTFPVWTPVVKAAVTPGGEVSAADDDDFKNPALKIAGDG